MTINTADSSMDAVNVANGHGSNVGLTRAAIGERIRQFLINWNRKEQDELDSEKNPLCEIGYEWGANLSAWFELLNPELRPEPVPG